MIFHLYYTFLNVERHLTYDNDLDGFYTKLGEVMDAPEVLRSSINFMTVAK